MGSGVETVYLAGPIGGLTYKEATEWRDEAGSVLASLGYAILDPMRSERALEVVDGPLTYEVAEPMVGDPFKRDVYDIRRADVLLVNLGDARQVATGTKIEMGMGYAWGKTIVLVVNQEEAALSPFLRGTATVIVHDLEAAYMWLEAMRPLQAGSYQKAPVYDDWLADSPSQPERFVIWDEEDET